MHDFDTSNFKLDPTGDGGSLQDVPDGTFKFQRGDISKRQGLRLKIQIPTGVTNEEGRQMTVSDIFDTKEEKHIVYGAQFADYITMGVHGVAITGGSPAPAQFCVRNSGSTAALTAAAPSPSSSSSSSAADLIPLLRQKIQDQVSPFKRF